LSTGYLLFIRTFVGTTDMEVLKKDLRLVKSLQQKKFRRETGLFVVEGRKMVEELMASGWEMLYCFSCDPDWADASKATLVSARDMETISSLSSPSPFLAVAKAPSSISWKPGSSMVLALDGISDPGNLGTILRTCDWFGVEDIVLSPNCAELYNPKTVQSTMGSLFRIKTYEESLSDMLQRAANAGYDIVGTVLNAHSVYSHVWQPRTVLVMGSESHGISEEVMAALRHRVTIPGKGKAESLNASVAAAITLSCWSERLSCGSSSGTKGG
jgi:RNA methyltransferase, TrmH family